VKPYFVLPRGREGQSSMPREKPQPPESTQSAKREFPLRFVGCLSRAGRKKAGENHRKKRKGADDHYTTPWKGVFPRCSKGLWLFPEKKVRHKGVLCRALIEKGTFGVEKGRSEGERLETFLKSVLRKKRVTLRVLEG